jgi:hypothetical protein
MLPGVEKIDIGLLGPFGSSGIHTVQISEKDALEMIGFLWLRCA